MREKFDMEFVSAEHAGDAFSLSKNETDDLVKVIDALVQLKQELVGDSQFGFKMNSESDFKFCAAEESDLEYGKMPLEIYKVGNDGKYLGLEFSINVDSLSLNRLSEDVNFPHNVCRYVADEIHDFFLCDNADSEEQEEFARLVYDSLCALAEKRIIDSKFGGVSVSKKITP
ncbi:hypothetical protein DIE14_15770 [Burkholderia sp. Bp9017]|nr:hypothetical protein DIE14_15770 [Burkholderia sp. Bp9017]RQZ33995.1 hypothetical protein DIE13_15680 [Burkholderia sp. Bp9016]